MASDGLREVTVNGVRFFRADDVERWHRQHVARAEYEAELEEELAASTDECNRLLDELRHAAVLALELHPRGACRTCDAIADRGMGEQRELGR